MSATETASSPRTAGPFVRSATTWIRYSQLGLVAFVIDGYAPTVRLVARDLHVSTAVASLHATAFGIGFVLAALGSGGAVRRFGRIRVAWVGVGGLCAGVGLYVTGASIILTLVGIAVAGLAGTLVQSAAYADLADVHGPNSPRALSEGSAVSQVAGIIAPVAVGAASVTVLGWRAGLAVVIVLAGAVSLAAAVRHCAYPVSSSGRRREGHGPRGRMSRRFWGVWASFVLVLGIEFCLSVWAPVELSARGDVGDAVATASPAVMLAGMTVGRVAVGALTRHVSVDVLLLTSIAVCVVGFTVFWIAPSGPVAIAALAVVGLGIAGQFPLSLARLIAVSGGRPDDASAWGSLALGVAIAGAPVLLGFLGNVVGVRGGLLLVPALCVVSGALVAVFRSGRQHPA
ncbi:MFS transporter [Curtobacterium sp. VKM Ac-1376]|uniref:MFS transporter n=1 Tax=Curtobacterium sp. VKM Ac-1376 TaxID=123312 RepID=UPI00188C81DC|nr:MFS transporter [Curtobacterium sp. VKM Ac-1376]MBF4616031.1 MFS transporter [Curtobacterium sp. VKM Ac-1376]